MNKSASREFIFQTAVFAVLIAVTFVVVALFALRSHMDHKLNQIIEQTCTHGESSITATFNNGKLHVSKPVSTGCTK